jgi:hypothetical protein
MEHFETPQEALRLRLVGQCVKHALATKLHSFYLLWHLSSQLRNLQHLVLRVYVTRVPVLRD